MLSISSLYCNYDPDCNGHEYPKLAYTISGSSVRHYRDLVSGEDILSIKEFDYSRLDKLVLDSSQYDYIVDVSKLLKLPITKLSIDTKTNYTNGSVEDILKGMKTVVNLKLVGFNGDLDLSGFNKARVITIDESDRLTNLTLPKVHNIELSLNECVIHNHELIPSLYNTSLISNHIEKFTIYQCRQTPRECMIIGSS